MANAVLARQGGIDFLHSLCGHPITEPNSICSEVQWTLGMSQLRTEELQENDDQECSAHDAGLDAVFRLRAGFGGPVELDVSDNEATWLL